MSRRDWTYLLALLVPLVVYNLALKAASVALQGEGGFPRSLSLMRSDLLFNAGYVLFWIGLFAAARRGIPRWLVVVLFHAASLLVVAVMTSPTGTSRGPARRWTGASSSSTWARWGR
ncbi:MAG: hypothetical protein M3426_17000 [Actinomycetota bacterium]|nr:hypothetical protein [Actinomycetota bacterium]